MKRKTPAIMRHFAVRVNKLLNGGTDAVKTAKELFERLKTDEAFAKEFAEVLLSQKFFKFLCEQFRVFRNKHVRTVGKRHRFERYCRVTSVPF